MDFDNAMQEVLKQTKYDKLTGRVFDWQTWLKERAMELLRSLLDKINIDFGSLFQPGSSGWISSWINILRILGIAVIILIGVRLALYIRKRIKRGKNSNGIFEGIDKNSATAGGLLEAAAQLAADGYPRDAVRYCLAAILLALDKKKIYRLNYTKTNGQILHELRSRAPSVIPALSAVIDVFNAVWFGHRGITPAQFDIYWRDSSLLVAEVQAYK